MRQVRSIAVDLLLIALATILAFYIRANFDLDWHWLAPLVTYVCYTLPAAAILLPLTGVTRTLWRFAGPADYWRLIVAAFLIVLVALGLNFTVSRLDSVPRSIPILQLLLIVLMLTGRRLVERLHRFRNQGVANSDASPTNVEKVVVVGLTAMADLFIQMGKDLGQAQIEVLAFVGSKDRDTGRKFHAAPVKGAAEDLERIVGELTDSGHVIERIVLAVPYATLSEVAREMLTRIETGTAIKVDCFADRLGFG